MSCLNQFSKCFNVAQSWWKCCLNVKQLESSWDTELLCFSSRSKLYAYVTLVVIGGVRIKSCHAAEMTFSKILVKSVKTTAAFSFYICRQTLRTNRSGSKMRPFKLWGLIVNSDHLHVDYCFANIAANI